MAELGATRSEEGHKTATSSGEEGGQRAGAGSGEEEGQTAATPPGEKPGQQPATSSSEEGGQRAGAGSGEEEGQTAATPPGEKLGQQPATSIGEEGGQRAGAESGEEEGNLSPMLNSEEQGQRTATPSDEERGQQPFASSGEDEGQRAVASSGEDEGQPGAEIGGEEEQLPSRPQSAVGRESHEDLGKGFNTNRSFPINKTVWARMWARARVALPDGQLAVAALQADTDDKAPPIPRVPNLSASIPVKDRLAAVQRYIEAFQYNHTGTQFFAVDKRKPLNRLFEVAKTIMQEALPIKCLEAVIVGLLLTSGMPQVDRFTISFKSFFQGAMYRHIVLGLHHQGMYGALGLSRRDTLMDKPLRFTSLGSLIEAYRTAYEDVWHTLVRVRLSKPVPHDKHSVARIDWRYFVVLLKRVKWADAERALDGYARNLRTGTFDNDAQVVRSVAGRNRTRRGTGRGRGKAPGRAVAGGRPAPGDATAGGRGDTAAGDTGEEGSGGESGSAENSGSATDDARGDEGLPLQEAPLFDIRI